MLALICPYFVACKLFKIQQLAFRLERHGVITSHVYWAPYTGFQSIPVLLLVFKSLDGLEPPYLTELLKSYQSTKVKLAAPSLSVILKLF